MPLVPANFSLSRKSYALMPETFTVTENPVHALPNGQTTLLTHSYTVEAVWFSRRKNKQIAAFFGLIWDSKRAAEDGSPAWPTLEAFLAEWDGRYGGAPNGCWDGTGTWWDKDYNADYDAQQKVLPFLRTMLTNYPAVPAGFEGWYSQPR